MGEERKVFEATDEMLPSVEIKDTIISTRSISRMKYKETKKAIRNIMYMVESNFVSDHGDIKFKRLRKAVLDNVNDLSRYFEEEILFSVYETANQSIKSLESRIFELEREKRDLLDLVERLNAEREIEEQEDNV